MDVDKQLIKELHMSNFKSALLLLAGGIAAVAATGVASASSADIDGKSIVVRYHLSDLSTDQGVHTLYAQIRAAAERVCPLMSGSRLPNSAVIECRQKAISVAVENIPSTRLAAIATHSKFG
jgi:UrcA family protein